MLTLILSLVLPAFISGDSLEIVTISGDTICTINPTQMKVQDLYNGKLGISGFGYHTFITADGLKLHYDDFLPAAGTLTMVTNTPHFSGRYPDSHLMEFLTKQSFSDKNINTFVDEKGRAILQHAVRAQNPRCVQKFIQMGADVNAIDAEMRNALFTAVYWYVKNGNQRSYSSPCLEIIYILMENGGYIDSNFRHRDFGTRAKAEYTRLRTQYDLIHTLKDGLQVTSINSKGGHITFWFQTLTEILCLLFDRYCHIGDFSK